MSTWLMGFALAAGLLSDVRGSAAAEDWTYVVPTNKPETFQPVLQPVRLSEECPGNLTETVKYGGGRPLYAQIRYGSPNSVRVTAVLDDTGSGDIALYVDANRNRIIEARDRVTGGGPRWQLPLDVAIVQTDTVVKTLPRTVVIQQSPIGDWLELGTLGYIQGTVDLAQGAVTARRVDGNANGSFADVEDRLWIDFNADDRWDPFTEQLPFTPIVRIQGERYKVRSDELGHVLHLDELAGVGEVQLTLPPFADDVEQVDVAATLIGEDGAAVRVQDRQVPVDIPAGRYRLTTVLLSLRGTNDRWNYLFSCYPDQEHVWYDVKAGETLTVDPIGTLDFSVEFDGELTSARPGATITVFPKLWTQDRLLVTTCFRGDEDSESSQLKGTVFFRSGDGELIDSHSCGFV